MQERAEQVYFGITDYIMLAAMLAFSLGIGIFFAVKGKKLQTKFEYLLGSGQMGAIPVCLSLFATYQSAISLLGTPAEVYAYGTMIIYTFIVPSLSYLLLAVTALPLFYPLKLTSINEYLERRYNSQLIRFMGTLITLTTSVTYMTVALLTPGLALQTAAGIPLWLSIALIGVIGTVYTAIGGIKSVIWTDVFQTFIIFAGMIVILIKGSYDVGGISNVMKVASNNGRVILDDFRIDPRVRHNFWGQSIGGLFYWFSFGFTQSTVQRISSLRSLKQARTMFLLSMPLALVYTTILVLSGLVIVAYFFVSECDPVAAGYIQNFNQLMPYLVMLTLGFLPGLPGIYIASIFSAALSTLSSGLNSLSAITVEDLLGKLCARRSDATVTMITKLIVCVYGFGIIGLAYLFRHFSGPVTQLTYSAISATSGPLTGLFILGATFPQTEAVGALSGTAAGLSVTIWLTIGSFMYGARAPRLPLGSTARCAVGNSSSIWAESTNVSAAEPRLTWAASSTTSGGMNTLQPTATSLYRVDKGFSLYDLSYTWSPFIGVMVTIIIGVCSSLIYRRLFKINVITYPSLLFPWAKKVWRIKDFPLELTNETGQPAEDKQWNTLNAIQKTNADL